MKKFLVLTLLVMSFSSYSYASYEESTQKLFHPMLNTMKCIEMSQRKMNEENSHFIKCFAPVSYGEITMDLIVAEKGNNIRFTWTIDRNQSGDIDQYIFGVGYEENRFYNLLMNDIPNYVASLERSKHLGPEFYPIRDPQILAEDHHYTHKFSNNSREMIILDKVVIPYDKPAYNLERRIKVQSDLRENKVVIYAFAEDIE